MCPICDNSVNKSIGIPKSDKKTNSIIRKKYEVVQCSNCGFYYVAPPIDFSKQEWNFLYDDAYFPQLSFWYYRRRESDRKKRINEIEKKCSNKIEKFLDIGCGTGEMLIESISKGWETFAIDITDNRTGMATDKLIHFSLGDLFEAEYPDNYFDVIYMDSVLEHLLNPLDYLREINRVLKKGGVVYIGIPNEDSLYNYLKSSVFSILRKNRSSRLQPFSTPYHVSGFNYRSLKFARDNSNFKLLFLRNFSSKTDFMNFKFGSKDFFKSFIISIIFLISVPFKMDNYFELILKK